MWLPEMHARAIVGMLGRHSVLVDGGLLMVDGVKRRSLKICDLRRFVAGSDVFSRQSDGTSVAKQYGRFGIRLQPGNMERVSGWAEVLNRLGDPNRGTP